MEIGPSTKLEQVIREYPFIIDFLVTKSPLYRNLKSPLMHRTVGKVASLAQVAAIGNKDLDELLRGIAAEIKKQAGEAVAVVGAGTPVDLGQERLEILKDIIRDLHAGAQMEELKERFQLLIRDVSASEIAAMEQKLIEDGMPHEEVQRLCDVHTEVFKSALETQPVPQTAAGHPVDTFMRENRAAEAVLVRIEAVLKELTGAPFEGDLKAQREPLTALLKELRPLEIHFQRKENQLFPLFEAHDVSGPSQVMWGLHDEIRKLLKGALAFEGDARRNVARVGELVTMTRDMIYKEEHILYPMALETLDEAEWGRVRRGEDEIGYAWVQPGTDWQPPDAAATPDAAPAPTGTLQLDTGVLTPEQVNLLLSHLPVDITFVNEFDRVAYYSKGEERIFPRSPAVIGREVRKCHPPASLHKVNKIVESFRQGKRDTAEFWLHLNGMYVYIRYFAVRDAAGHYRGCLEVSQNIAPLQEISGERRIARD